MEHDPICDSWPGYGVPKAPNERMFEEHGCHLCDLARKAKINGLKMALAMAVRMRKNAVLNALQKIEVELRSEISRMRRVKKVGNKS